MLEEIHALTSNNTWQLVPLLLDRHIVSCKWVYKIKRNKDGSIARYKAQLVVKRYHQEEGIDYFETFSPVVRPTTIHISLLQRLIAG
jgi:Reverse transcriptase (RNA-dependent DNA polymerase)